MQVADAEALGALSQALQKALFASFDAADDGIHCLLSNAGIADSLHTELTALDADVQAHITANQATRAAERSDLEAQVRCELLDS